MAEEPKRNPLPALSGEEVSADAMQLITVSVFNGVCRIARALAQNGLLDADQIGNIHDAMTTPLDDPDLADDEMVSFARTTLESVLSEALRDAREG
jgi:hypothetical protein